MRREERDRRREQDRRDWEAINDRKQRERDEARERAHRAQAEEHQRQVDADDKAAVREFQELLGRVEGLSDAEVDKRIKRYKRRTGRDVTQGDRARIKRAQGKKRRWWQ